MFIHFNDEYNVIYGMYNYIQLLKGSSQLSTLSVKMSPYLLNSIYNIVYRAKFWNYPFCIFMDIFLTLKTTQCKHLSIIIVLTNFYL